MLWSGSLPDQCIKQNTKAVIPPKTNVRWTEFSKLRRLISLSAWFLQQMLIVIKYKQSKCSILFKNKQSKEVVKQRGAKKNI